MRFPSLSSLTHRHSDSAEKVYLHCGRPENDTECFSTSARHEAHDTSLADLNLY